MVNKGKKGVGEEVWVQGVMEEVLDSLKPLKNAWWGDGGCF